jgi:hypothetical protein
MNIGDLEAPKDENDCKTLSFKVRDEIEKDLKRTITS